MNSNLSQYLNLLRAVAAIAVYLFHTRHFAQAAVPFFGGFGGEAVIVFFVLSGFLISYASTRQPDGRAFMVARFARLWSVAVPALLLTMLADSIGQAMCLDCYAPMQPYSLFKWVASLGAAGLFLNQAWQLNIFPGTNGPFWSLSYEFWYYVLLAAGVYLRGGRRIACLALAAAIAGPKILVGFPIWLMGALVYWRSRQAGAMTRPVLGWVLWSASIALALWMHLGGAHEALSALFPQAAARAATQWNVNFWPESYLTGALVAMHIYGFISIAPQFAGVLQRLRPLIAIGADASFGLYLFHYPLLYLTKTVLHQAGLTQGPLFIGVMYVVPFVVAVLLALHCERLKGPLQRVLTRLGAGRARAVAGHAG